MRLALDNHKKVFGRIVIEKEKKMKDINKFINE